MLWPHFKTTRCLYFLLQPILVLCACRYMVVQDSPFFMRDNLNDVATFQDYMVPLGVTREFVVSLSHPCNGISPALTGLGSSLYSAPSCAMLGMFIERACATVMLGRLEFIMCSPYRFVHVSHLAQVSFPCSQGSPSMLLRNFAGFSRFQHVLIISLQSAALSPAGEGYPRGHAVLRQGPPAGCQVHGCSHSLEEG